MGAIQRCASWKKINLHKHFFYAKNFAHMKRGFSLQSIRVISEIAEGCLTRFFEESAAKDPLTSSVCGGKYLYIFSLQHLFQSLDALDPF